MTGIAIVDDIAVVAEELDHHPDVDIRWRKLTFTLSTRSKGGVTERDLELARRIDGIAERHGAG
jgi:4a-hydroxytetrahydrobiopterin dehydratase